MRRAEGKLSEGERNRDVLLARLSKGLERRARDLDAAVRRMAPGARRKLRPHVEGLRAAAREIGWIGTGSLDHPRLRRCDLVALVRTAAEPWARGLARRGSVLVIEAAPRRIVARWDRAHVDALVGELVSNAAKHGAGRPIRVEVRQRAGGVVALIVEDQGTGTLPRPPFVRFSRGKTATGEGMGVGLWLVDAIARLSGGRLRFSGAAGGGTRATVTLKMRD